MLRKRASLLRPPIRLDLRLASPRARQPLWMSFGSQHYRLTALEFEVPVWQSYVSPMHSTRNYLAFSTAICIQVLQVSIDCGMVVFSYAIANRHPFHSQGIRMSASVEKEDPVVIYNRILRRTAKFSNLNLAQSKKNIELFLPMGIPEEDFAFNENSSARNSYFVQLGALTKIVKEFDDQFDTNDESNSVAPVNFVLYLAASLFKLNLHMCIDPMGSYSKSKQEEAEVQKGVNLFCSVMKCDQQATSSVINALLYLREFSRKAYISFLEDGKAHSLTQEELHLIKKHFTKLGDSGEYVIPALIIALSYTSILFDTGTTKNLHDQVSVRFTVEKDGNGYKPGTVIDGFHTRFAKYAGSYAQWYEVEGDKLVSVEDFGEFNPNQKILLAINGNVILTMMPEFEWAIPELNGGMMGENFALLPMVEKIGNKPTLVAYPIL